MEAEHGFDFPKGVTPGIPVDLQADGVLWLVNAAVFHPRGFALGYNPESGKFSLLGDGKEAWTFRDDGTIDTKFASVQELFERAAACNTIGGFYDPKPDEETTDR